MLRLLAFAFILQERPNGGCPGAAPAVLVVECPPGATLFVDAVQVKQTGARRRLVTPPLPAGGRYGYTLRLREDGEETARRNVEFGAGETVEVTLLPAERAAPNFGLDLPALRRGGGAAAAGQVRLNGQPIGREEALRLLRGGPAGAPPEQGVPDDGAQRRLTIIGSAADCAATLQELEGPLRALAAGLVVKAYRPTDWAVAKAGFKTDGAPTIYAQEPDGKVLFRQDDGADLRKNLEALRKPHPDYRPEKDPDYRKTPAPSPPPSPLPPPAPAEPEESAFPFLCLGLAAGLTFLAARQ